MSSALPTPAQCCTPTCSTTTSINIPGPAGEPGEDGTNGTDGQNAFTTFNIGFTIPAELGSDTAEVGDTSWMSVNQIVFASKADGSVSGYFQVTAIPSSVDVTLKNLEDTPNNSYSTNSAPGSLITPGSRLSPAGLQGPSGSVSGSAGGDLKGTYPNPKIGIGNTKGSSLWGNGTDIVAVAAGANGYMQAFDSTDAEGIKNFKALPITGDADVLDNAVPRLNGGTGLPVPLQSSRISITDTGAIQSLGSGGDPRGADSVDLQVNRSGATQVASGATSFIGGGTGNTVSSARAVCVGGDTNIVSSTEGFVGGGEGNQAITGDRAAVCSGQNNVASGTESFIGGGQDNEASASHATVAGGDSNTASAQDSFVGGGEANNASSSFTTVAGGSSNTASATGASVLGGGSNTASSTSAAVGGGNNNTASGAYSIVPGGLQAIANKHGQYSHSAGQFATAGDSQVSVLVARVSTSDATPTTLKLDGSVALITVPNNTSWMFQIMVLARTSAGLDAIYTSVGVIRNNAGTTSVSGVTTTEVFDGASLPVTPVVVAADDPNDALSITVTGIVATNIRWTARIQLTEVSY